MALANQIAGAQAALTLDPLVVISFLIAIIADFVFPLALGAGLARRFKLRWIVFIYGAVVFTVSQMIIRVPLVQLAQGALRPQLVADNGGALTWTWITVLALTAGLFEEGGRWLGYRWFFRRTPRTWANALLYGTGHEAAESILLVGLSVVSSLVIYLLFTQGGGALTGSLSPDQLTQIRQTFATMAPWEPLLGAVERVLAMAFQISASVLVLQAFVRRNIAWVGVAILWHALTDFLAVALKLWTQGIMTSQERNLLIEGMLFVIALISIGIILYFRPSVPEDSSPPLLSLTAEGGTGATPLRTSLSLAPAGEVETAPRPTAAPEGDTSEHIQQVVKET